MVKLSKLEAEIVTTRSKQPQVEINPDNPWTRSTPKVLVHLWLINRIKLKANEPVQRRKRPTLKDAPPLTFPKLPKIPMPKTPESIRRIADDIGSRVRSLSSSTRDRSRDRMRRASLELAALPAKFTPRLGRNSTRKVTNFLSPDVNRDRSKTQKMTPVERQAKSQPRQQKDLSRSREHNRRSSRVTRSLSNRRIAQLPPSPLPTDNPHYDQGT